MQMITFWGILIGVGLTVLGVLLGIAVSSGKSMTPLSYIIIVLALAAFSIEGIMMVKAYDQRRNTKEITDTVSGVITGALQTFLPDVAYDYHIGPIEAPIIRTAIRPIFPGVARFLEPSDLVGKTIPEATEILSHCVVRNASQKMWMTGLYMVITLVVMAVLMLLAASLGGGGSHRVARRATAASHGRAPRNVSRGRRR